MSPDQADGVTAEAHRSANRKSSWKQTSATAAVSLYQDAPSAAEHDSKAVIPVFSKQPLITSFCKLAVIVPVS